MIYLVRAESDNSLPNYYLGEELSANSPDLWESDEYWLWIIPSMNRVMCFGSEGKNRNRVWMHISKWKRSFSFYFDTLNNVLSF